MKKYIIAIICITMVVALGACSKLEKEQIDTEDAPVGAYTPAESTDITEKVTNLVEDATADIEGATYEPIAYLGSQVVAGTNHAILCKVILSDMDATEQYVIAEIYEDLDGNVSLYNVEDCVDDSGNAVTEVTDEMINVIINDFYGN